MTLSPRSRGLLAVLFCGLAPAAPPRMDTILYGASYYHEYMPYDRLERDVELMQKAGISVVRLGESTWSNWEPSDGRFEFAWMDRVIDRLHRAGIRVILGTPTYAIPPWLYRAHPEVLVTRLGGQKAQYGWRQNMDITHPVYRQYAERVIRRIVGHYRDHPAVIGFQVDNETSSYGTAGQNVQRGFVQYLKAKFETPATLNRLWGLAYWSQLLHDWDDFPPRDGAIHPGHRLEWERYQRQLVTDFLAWQASLVRELQRPDQFIVHNFSGGVHSEIDQFAISEHLDIVGVNPYYAVQEQLDGWYSTLCGDLCRSLKRGNFLITETMAQTTAWNLADGWSYSKWQTPPYDGQIRLNAYSHLADGANMVAYWHWHSTHYGQETYWKGVLGHDLEPNRVYEEVRRVAQELRRIGPQLVNLKKRNAVAILYSIDSFHGIEFMPFSDRVNYMTILEQLHRVLYRLNVGADFVTPASPNISDYRLLLVPPLYVASDATLEKLAAYVKAGGHVVMSFKSGFTDEWSTVRPVRAPGPLRQAAGFSYQEFSSFKDTIPLRGDPYRAGPENKVSVWAEMLRPETAKPLAWFDHPFLGAYPGLTRNEYGRGTLTYEGTVLSDELQKRVLLEVLKIAGLDGPGQQLPEPVRLKHGTGQDGRRLHYYLNYSGSEQRFRYGGTGGVNLLTGAAIGNGQAIVLGPWDLAIVKEQ